MCGAVCVQLNCKQPLNKLLLECAPVAQLTYVLPCLCSSLFVLTADNPLRRCCMAIATSPWLEGFILLIIIFSSILLALDKPTLDRQSSLGRVVATCDIVFAFIFLTEMCIKVRVVANPVAMSVWLCL